MRDAISKDYVLSSSAQGNVVTVLISPYLLETIGLGDEDKDQPMVMWLQESEWSWAQYFDSFSLVTGHGRGLIFSHSQHFSLEGAATKFYLYLPLAEEVLSMLTSPQFIFLRKLRDMSQVSALRKETVMSVSEQMEIQCAAGAPLLFVDHVKYAS